MKFLDQSATISIAEIAGGRRRTALWAAALACVSSLIGATLAAADTDVSRELECLALTIYFEARGEPDDGKRAVGHVVMNRAMHPLFPRKVCEVVQQGGEKFRNRCQFTWWCDGRSDQPTQRRNWKIIKVLARTIYWDKSRDPTGGALWYHADNVRPQWHSKLARGPKIGRHIFYGLFDDWLGKALPDQHVFYGLSDDGLGKALPDQISASYGPD
jgi:hypothetical protein